MTKLIRAKLSLTVLGILVFSANLFAQKPETFDIATFQAPKGWNKQVGQDAIQFSIEDKDNYCLVTLFRSASCIGSPKENFDAAWDKIVKEAVTVSTVPQMFPADTKGEWLVAGGFAPFEKDGAKGVAVLYTASGYGKMVNALVLTNTQAYENVLTAFLESISFKKPDVATQQGPAENSIRGTWGKNQGAHMTYGDPVASGMAGYSKDQYTFNTDGTYTFVSKTFRMAYDKIILVIENGAYQINGDTIAIKPQKSVVQAWSKQNGGDNWGRLLSTQNRALETVNYRFTKHYFSGIQLWNLILQADQPTVRDGPFSNNTLFQNAWYYSPISANNPVVELPRQQN